VSWQRIGIGRTRTFLFFRIIHRFGEIRTSDIAGKNDAVYLYRQEDHEPLQKSRVPLENFMGLYSRENSNFTARPSCTKPQAVDRLRLRSYDPTKSSVRLHENGAQCQHFIRQHGSVVVAYCLATPNLAKQWHHLRVPEPFVPIGQTPGTAIAKNKAQSVLRRRVRRVRPL